MENIGWLIGVVVCVVWVYVRANRANAPQQVSEMIDETIEALRQAEDDILPYTLRDNGREVVRLTYVKRTPTGALMHMELESSYQEIVLSMLMRHAKVEAVSPLDDDCKKFNLYLLA